MRSAALKNAREIVRGVQKSVKKKSMLKMLSDVSATKVESLYLLLFKNPFSWRFSFRSL